MLILAKLLLFFTHLVALGVQGTKGLIPLLLCRFDSFFAWFPFLVYRLAPHLE